MIDFSCLLSCSSFGAFSRSPLIYFFSDALVIPESNNRTCKNYLLGRNLNDYSFWRHSFMREIPSHMVNISPI